MLFEAHLESPNDGQTRRRIVDVATVEDARKLIEQREANRTAYSLLDCKPVEQITTRRAAGGVVHATVNTSVFAGTGLGGQDLIDHVERDHHVESDGRVKGPNGAYRVHLQAHYQEQPYKIVSLEPLMPNVASLITGLQQLHGNPKAWARALKQMKDAGLPMGAVTGSLYGLTSQGMIDGSGSIVWSSATIKMALTTSAYTPNQDTHHFFSDITNEITGTGYTAGGVTLGSKTSTYDSASDQTRLDAADASWTTSTLTARRAILWDDTAGASTTDPVMGWIDFGADVSTTAGTFSIVFDATGIVVYDVT